MQSLHTIRTKTKAEEVDNIHYFCNNNVDLDNYGQNNNRDDNVRVVVNRQISSTNLYNNINTHLQMLTAIKTDNE